MQYGIRLAIVTIICAFLMSSCNDRPPFILANQVDIPRFMGKWYVIASIPTSFEQGIENATETYTLKENNTVQTVFTFKETGKSKKYKAKIMRAFITEHPSNAVWEMQPFWPIRADFRVSYVGAQYQTTIIARLQRDYVWIMARTPSIDEKVYTQLVQQVDSLGYDIQKLKKVPQKWESLP